MADSKDQSSQNPVMNPPEVNPKITIKSIVPGTNNLDLSDKGFTLAEKNTDVTWEIAADSGVEEIIDIQRKEGSEEVFKDRPKKQSGKKDWKGKTKDSVNHDTKEYYSIFYTKKDDPHKIVFIYDPIIQVNA